MGRECRVLKFRALSVHGKWIYWNLNQPLSDVLDMTTCGQFTGLHDKNGKEIFEGDILRWRTDELDDWYVVSVKWGGDYPAFEISPNGFDDCNGLQYIVLECETEVLGNIHEHKPLLEREK